MGHPLYQGGGSLIYNSYRPCQCSHSWTLVPWDSGPYYSVSDLRFLQLEGSGLCFYILQEQSGWPNYNPRHWVPFLLPLVTLRAVMEVFKPASTWSVILTNLLFPVMWLQVGSLREHRFQHLFFLCVHMGCHGHVFIEPLPCSGWFFSHHFTVLSTISRGISFWIICPGKPPTWGINE
jgi:hypothetical protein